MSDIILAAVIVIIVALLGASAGIYVSKSQPKQCAKTHNEERLAYSTYHSDGKLECTYIPNATYGMARRTM